MIVLNDIINELQAIPDIVAKSDLEQAIERVVDSNINMKNSLHQYDFYQYLSKCKTSIGFDRLLLGYICRGVGINLNIKHLVFLGCHILCGHELDERDDPIAAMELSFNASKSIFDEFSRQFYHGQAGLVHLRLKEFEEAISHLSIAIDIALFNDDKPSLGMYYQNKGVAYAQLNDLDKAWINYSVALNISEEIQDQFIEIRKQNLRAIEIERELTENGFSIHRIVASPNSNLAPDELDFSKKDQIRIEAPFRSLKDCPFFYGQWIIANSGNIYNIHCLISSGATSLVYLASEKKSQHPNLAIKIFSPSTKLTCSNDHLIRFKQEISLYRKLKHNNVCRMLDEGVYYDGKPYIVMEYYSKTLRDCLSVETMPIMNLFNIWSSIFYGLEYLHDNNVIHRDLKPENIMINGEQPKIGDLGIALICNCEIDSITSTASNLGTKDYMSPEQRESPHFVTTSSDYYSLGVILYEMITNIRIVPRSNISEYIKIAQPNMKLKAIELVVDLVIKMLSHEINERPTKDIIRDYIHKINNII